MKKLPEPVIKAWDEREPIAVLSTVAPDGTPNAIYVGIVGLFNGTTFFIANNYFHKTKENILSGSKASLLFITKEKRRSRSRAPSSCRTAARSSTK